MAVIENGLTEIFTDIDNTIFSEGSLDPLGLRIIWTSLGNKIFKNRLNTISSNIRSYTINLFHHSIVYECQKRFDDKILNIIGSPPYNNRQQFYEGLILFLESTLIHVICELDNAEFTDVPGTSKLKGINRRSPDDPKAKYLFVDRNTGILVRHIGLGIHGRHKGPFQQIGLFSKNDFYEDTELWDEVHKQFQKLPWKSLADELIAIIDKKVLSPKMRAAEVIKLPKSVIDEFCLKRKYRNILDRELFRSKELILFWENKLGLLDGAAGELYKEVKKNNASTSYEQIIKNAIKQCTPEEKLKLEAICAIEPFISFLQKTISLLLTRGTNEISDELKLLLGKWINGTNINIFDIVRFESYLDQGPKIRLRELLNIYESNSKNIFNLVKGLISYHEKIMDIRGNNSWISISENGKIKIYQPANYNENYLQTLKSNDWLNSYYLPTVRRIFDGLHKVEDMKLYQAYKKVVEELLPIEVAWFTTFNVNVELFEKFLLGQLGGKEATELKTAEDFEALNEEVKNVDIKVFYDYRMPDLQKPKRTTVDFIAINPSRILKEPSEAIFHPKVIFLKGKNDAFILTGSANLSFAAWSSNEEAVIIRKITKYRNAREILDFFESIGTNTSSLNNWVNSLPRKNSEWKFVHSFNKKKDIIEEFLPADELTVWSPYFSEKTSTLINAVHDKGIKKVNLVPDFTEYGKIRITEEQLEIINKSADCELKCMPPCAHDTYRLVHAKVWLTKGKIGVGSWNFSKGATGLNIPQNKRNIEAGIVSSINNKEALKLLNKLKPLNNSKELASTLEELSKEKDLINKFTYSCNIYANWQSFEYEFDDNEVDSSHTVRLPHNNKKLFPLGDINNLPFLDSYFKLLNNKTFSVYDKNENEIFQGFLIEKEKTKRPVYSYSSLKDLFEALIDNTNSSIEKRNVAYSNNGESDDGKGEIIPLIQFSKSESYYLMFVSFQKLYERIVSSKIVDLDKIAFRYPQSLTNITKLVVESMNNAVKELNEDSLLFHWFLINELNRCINLFNERSSIQLKVVSNLELGNIIKFSEQDKNFINKLKGDFQYEFI